MKKLLFFVFILLCFNVSAQETTDSNRGTIKVQKKGTLHSVIYDDVNYRLICKDIYGNILDSAIVSFAVNVTVKGIAFSEDVTGTTLSGQMQQRLSRMDGEVTLLFSNVKAKEKDGSIITFPKFKAKTGQSRERFDN